MLLLNNTFQLVKISFFNPVATFQSSIKLEQLVDLVKKMSVQDLYNQFEREAAALEHDRDNETEWNKAGGVPYQSC